MSEREKGERPSSGRQGAIGRGDSKFTHTIPWWHTYSHPHILLPPRVRVSFSLHRSSKIDSRPRFGRFPRTDFTRAYPVAPFASRHHGITPRPPLPSHQPNQDHSIRGGCVSLRSAPTTTTISSPVRHLAWLPIGMIRSDSIPPKQVYHVGGFILRDISCLLYQKGSTARKNSARLTKKPQSNRHDVELDTQ